MSQIIVCPSCKNEINLEKLSEEKYKQNLEKEFEKEREEMRKKAIEFAKNEALKQAKKDALEMEDLKTRLKEQEKLSEEMKKNELEIRKKNRLLEEKEKNFELEMARKMDEEKKKLEEKLKKDIKETSSREFGELLEKKDEEHRKKELEYQKQQDQMKKTIDDLKRKAEQGSQQIQGDIQEDDLKQAILQAFPIDLVDDVPTGIKGADLIQTVNNNLGQIAGTIVWESKNTKAWQENWVMKLKEDKLKVNGNIAILITTVLPKNIKHFGLIDDVMVSEPEFAILVCNMLRDKLLSISKVEKSLEGKDLKMEMLYKYLSSEEFSSKINMMIDVFSNLKTGIDAEKRSMERNWKKREKDLERATLAISGMYGELESLMGQALPGSEKLELAEGIE